jgi:glycogen operon protein
VKPHRFKPGSRYPFGARPDAKGVNFSVFSRHATAVELLLFENSASAEPFQTIALDPVANCTFFAWHVYVQGLEPGVYYNWRIDGPGDHRARSGFRFDAQKALLDPWARAVCDRRWDRARASQPGPNHDAAIRGAVVNEGYDWGDDRPLHRPAEDVIIYELHVGGFTRHPSAGVAHPGTFGGLIEKIPYLQELGITHVELMPIMAFDEQDVPDGVAARGLKNYWGYSTHSFFAPHPGYCASAAAEGTLKGFRDLVKALHRAEIGVILDVVFNHTAEGGDGGPWINFKGFGNEMFYHLDPHNRERYVDYTGCGNSVNANHPLVARFITECLEYWVREMHVDGFRFDLASALARGEDGIPQYHAPVLWSIEFSDALARTRLIAEAWDAGGLYQVGDFPGFRWQEWNGRYRDVVRRFVRGDPGLIGELATRLSGSSDLYQAAGRLPVNSINFVTSHDGFTLYDQVSYNEKHNEENGEGNRDGHSDNLSWNCGHEGDTDDAEIVTLRGRQAKNFISILLLSQGVPMLLAGDEVLRSQKGNNNAWCQDNELGWFDWTLTRTNRNMLRFVREMISFRKRHACLRRRHFLTGSPAQPGDPADVVWHGYELERPLWDDPGGRLLAYTLAAVGPGSAHLHIVLNMSEQSHALPLPAVGGRQWYRAIDTAQAAPHDIVPALEQSPVGGTSCVVSPRSVVVLEARQMPVMR